MKKTTFLGIILSFTILLLNFGGVAATAYKPSEPVSAKAYYLMSLDTGEMIAEKNSDKLRYPASLTKVMTAILALENTTDLDFEEVTFPNYVQDYLYTYQKENGAVSLGGLVAGETLTMRKMLYCMLLPSANEAAMVIADHIGGSQEKFIAMMNARAKELGCTNTNFANPNGLFSKSHVTTAADMAKIMAHAITLPNFLDIVNTTEYDSGPTNKHENLHWKTTNQMIIKENEYYYPGLSGVKTGTLPESGRCFASTATRDGFSYLLVVLDSEYMNKDGEVTALGNQSFRDTATIYDWVFDSFKVKTLVEKGKYVAEVPLNLSMEKDFIKLMTADRFTSLVYKEVEAASVVIVPDVPASIDAPVKKNDKIGTAKLMLSGEEIGTVDLLSAETVDATPLLVMWEKVKAILRSFWFKFGVVYFVLLVIAYMIMMVSRNNRRRQMEDSRYRPRRRI